MVLAHSDLVGICLGDDRVRSYADAVYSLDFFSASPRRDFFRASSSTSPIGFPIAIADCALAGLVMAIPFGLAMGAPLSATLLKIQLAGLAGWKWLFLLEGLPAVVLGVVTLFVLDDRPQDAKWLSRTSETGSPTSLMPSHSERNSPARPPSARPAPAKRGLLTLESSRQIPAVTH